MSEIKIFYNCYKYLELPDDYFMQLLIIILGDVKNFRKFFSENADLIFQNTQVYVSFRSCWNSILYKNGLDLRITEKEYQIIIEYVRNKNFL